MDFPQSISFTLTNACNLRCHMCGQWSEEGYVRADKQRIHHELALADWIRLVDELAEHNIQSLLLRGGETFMFPGIIELLNHIHSKGLFISIDTNGTMLNQYAADIVRIGKIHLTISMDGPEEVHDMVRGVKGTYRRIADGVAAIHAEEGRQGQKISLSLNFTISGVNYQSMSALPDVARRLGIGVVCIVPYYYFPESVGHAYERELKENLDCQAYSWAGFHHEESGVDFETFRAQLQQYQANLGEVYNYPYMAFSEDDYRQWFTDATTTVWPQRCTNVDKLIDIQPDGSANFCVDFPDYSFGNVKTATIAQLWNSPEAERFRQYRRLKPLGVCYRCGAKYMSDWRTE
jgi:MoaA/NifB/PqqE/SkfB family radical SAM enzyme